ncbi:hypothetical protein NLG97_g3624 [Lecanicillium saksenae]|uniref:Uncharacterized protein n=1 Tax=Lecanicillium saksenae TaxID=468837 RepID=A0ACC1R0W7_9HYPO|nr:hypothetical protein NLG97_g3624 [Lecanicillium saksenae]
MTVLPKRSPTDFEAYDRSYKYEEIDCSSADNNDHREIVNTHGQSILDWSLPLNHEGGPDHPSWPRDANGRPLLHFLTLVMEDSNWNCEKAEHRLLQQMHYHGYYAAYNDLSHPDHAEIFNHCNAILRTVHKAFAECRPYNTSEVLSGGGASQTECKYDKLPHEHLAEKLKRRVAYVASLYLNGRMGYNHKGEKVQWRNLLPPQSDFVAYMICTEPRKLDNMILGKLAAISCTSLLDLPIQDVSSFGDPIFTVFP